MRLLVGLGNPGPKYSLTRHNAGFMVLDQIAQRSGLTWDPSTQKFDGVVARGNVLDVPCLLLKPLTFMNLSGKSVAKVLNFYKIDPALMTVLHDDIDVPSGKVKARVGGGHGGNNGVRSIIDETGVSDFSRIKLGVGKPGAEQPGLDVRDWVLQKFTDDELAALEKVMVPEALTRLRGIFLS